MKPNSSPPPHAAPVTAVASVLRASRAVVVLVGLLWTVWWGVRGWAHMQAESLVVQQGFGGDGVQMWELFDLQMVMAHIVVRWLPGVLLAGAVWWWLRRRGRAESADAAELETGTSLAA